MRRVLTSLGVTCVMSVALSAGAEPASSPVQTDEGAPATGDGIRHDPLQIGIFGGLLFPPKAHTLRDPSKPRQNYEDVAPEFGVRAGYYPIEYFGLEAEAALAPTATESGHAAKLFALRAQAVAQIPTRSLTPFAVLGLGGMFTAGNALGNEGDSSFHFGGGAKLPLGERTGLRMELRDSVIMNSAGDPTHYPELLFGLGFGFGGVTERAPAPALPADSDADGIDDPHDACPNEAAATADGCPIRDSDKDGVADGADRCPEVAGTTADGCPNPDADQDGVPASRDRCPDVSGVEPDGCPNLDADKDGVNLPNDLCPDQLETVNGFEDADGCPDQMPEKMKQFSGVIQGVEFDFGKASIRAKSFPVLDAAAAALKEYKSLRVRVTGHTDSVGAHDVNLERSRARAESVKDYLVKQGVEAARIETRGAGPDEPLGDNKTEAGRQKNRRIEFAIIKQ